MTKRDSTNSFAATLVKLEANLNREHGPADSLDTSKTIELVPISKPWLPALSEAIGRGASGTVHLATNLLDGYPIAVKKITIEMPNQTNQSPPLSTQIQRTATEIVMLEKHLHKNIVLYQSATLHSNVVLILMEYCAGGSLASFLKIPNVMPNEKAVQGWTFELLGGLKCLHDSGFIHGDIKPDSKLPFTLVTSR
jgi:serine/threonine protein kinase